MKLYDTVKCAGFNWYIIDIKGNEVTLLAKDNFFGYSEFSSGSNDYRTSKIRRYLMKVSEDLGKKGAPPLLTNLSDVNCADRVFLLSIEEVNKLPREIRKFSCLWWLRSPGNDSRYVSCVYDDGSVGTEGNDAYYFSCSVRPAIRVPAEILK